MTASESQTKYREDLPPSCPPAEPTPPSTETLWRLLKNPAVSESDFDSQRKRLPSQPYPDECGARAVSLMTSLAACRAAVKTPRMRNMKFTHAIAVAYDPDHGTWDQDAGHHVNWWPLAKTAPLSLTGKVESLND